MFSKEIRVKAWIFYIFFASGILSIANTALDFMAYKTLFPSTQQKCEQIQRLNIKP
jgi:hypothetical protein